MTEEEARAAMAAKTLVEIRGGLAAWLIVDLPHETNGDVRATLYRPGKARGYRRYHVSLHRLAVI